MIRVDSSVWIAHLRRHRNLATDKLEAAFMREAVQVGHLMLLEFLQGARNDAHAARIERGLRQYTVAPLLGAALATCAARHPS